MEAFLLFALAGTHHDLRELLAKSLKKMDECARLSAFESTLTAEQFGWRNTAKCLIQHLLARAYKSPPNLQDIMTAPLSPHILAGWGETQLSWCFRDWCHAAGISEYKDDGGLNNESLNAFVAYIFEGHVHGVRKMFHKLLRHTILCDAKISVEAGKLPWYVLIAALFDRDADKIFCSECGAFCVNKENFGVCMRCTGGNLEPAVWYAAKTAGKEDAGGAGGAGGAGDDK